MSTLTKQQTERANFILERATAMLKVKDVYSKKWPEYEKIWKMAENGKTGDDKWRADLPETWTYATIKTFMAAFVDSKVIPTIIRHEDDPKSKAEDLRDLYTDVAEKGNLDLELYYTRLDIGKLGNGFTKTVYRKDKRTIYDIEKFDPKTNTYTWKKKEINDFDDPHTRRVSPYMMLVDDLAKADWNTARDCIELEVMGRDDAEDKYGEYIKDFNQIPESTMLMKQLTPSTTTTIAETDGTGLRGTEFENLNKYTFFAPGFEWSDEVVEVLHYWNKVKDCYEILINGYPVKVKTDKDPSPIPYVHKQLPYTHYAYSPYSGDEFWAAGIIEIGKTRGDSIQKKEEMMTDRQKLSLFAPAFCDVNDEFDQKNLNLKPLSVYRTKGGKPTFANIPGITNGDIEMLNRDESAYKRVQGVDERILGIESAGPAITATEMSFLREAALKRLKDFAFLYKNALLHGEIKLKLSLFKQYYSNPLSAESKVKNDPGNRIAKNKFKEFNVKTGNVYTRKEISPNYFEGEVDVDLDLQLLLPMTQAQLVTMWSQLIRDSVPAIQAGILDWSIKKMYDGYAESLGRNPNSLKEDKTAMAIEVAESEHALYADPNTSKHMDKMLPNGTDKKYLTEEHILKHNELLESDVHMENAEKAKLIEHIEKDIENYKKLQAEQSQPNMAAMSPQAMMNVGGLGQPRQSIPQTPQPVVQQTNTIPMQ